MAVHLIERGQIAAKIETTKGTANAPVAVDAGIMVWDLGLTERVDIAERNPVGAAFDDPAGIPEFRAYELTFRAEIQGGTTAGSRPPIWALLRACGLSETISASTSVTYALITAESSQECVTIDVYRDGKRYRLTGAMGNAVFVFERGTPTHVEFTFVGVYNAPVDAGLLATPPYVAVAPPAPVSATLTLMSNTLRAVGFRCDLGNQVELREDVTNAAGFIHAVIVDRKPRITVEPEDDLVATVEWLTKKTGGTLGEFVGTFGTVAGNIHRILAPAAQVVGAGFGERGGRITRTLELACRGLAAFTNDSVSYRIT